MLGARYCLLAAAPKPEPDPEPLEKLELPGNPAPPEGNPEAPDEYPEAEPLWYPAPEPLE